MACHSSRDTYLKPGSPEYTERASGSHYSVQSGGNLDEEVVLAIARHFARDGVDQDVLYDVESILNRHDPFAAQYAPTSSRPRTMMEALLRLPEARPGR